MATTAANVRVAVSGGAYHAPLGSTLPTDAETAVGVEFSEVGYVSEDGLVQAMEAETEDIRAWQNGDIVRKVQTSHDLTYQFSMLETTNETLSVYYGAEVVGGALEIRGEQLPHKCWVFDILDGDNIVRVVLPDAQVTERGEVTYTNSEAVAYDVTITAYPDADGVKAYMYIENTSPES